MAREFPYTPDDLEGIAARVKEILDGLGGDIQDLGDWRWGVSVEVSYEDDIVGHIKPFGDGWLGFYPLAVTE